MKVTPVRMKAAPSLFDQSPGKQSRLRVSLCFKLLPTSHQVGHYVIHQEKYLLENDDSYRVL